MMEKIKSNFTYALCAALGLLQMLFMMMPFYGVFMKAMGQSESVNFNGFSLLKMKFAAMGGDLGEAMEELGGGDGLSSGFLFTMAGILQLLALLLALAMLTIGVLALLKEYNMFDKFPEKLGNYETKKLANLAIRVFGALNFVSLMLLVMFGAANTLEESFWGITVSAGVSVGAGAWLAGIIGFAGSGAVMFLPKYVPGLDEGSAGPQVAYHCVQCGKKASKTEKFCNSCGGAVVAEEVKQYNYVCEKCGKKAKKTDKFCNACGGAIVTVEVKHYERVCEKCGKKAKKSDKFCNDCGGAIVEREITNEVPVAPAAPVAPAGRVCPNCGKEVADGQRFCIGCGTMLQ